MRLNDWLKKNREQQIDDVEYYEDTHDERGNYVGRRVAPPPAPNQLGTIEFDSKKNNYGNIAVYCPASPEDVEMLISFLKRGEPAVANLDDLDEESAQRILDFLSGAIFALDGSIHRITGNIFLLSPRGVEIQSHMG